jgi:hypothetical protein
MDETTRMIIAYATLLFGLPMLAAKIVWFIPSIISSRPLTQIAGRLDQFTDAVVEGFISLLLACLIFQYLTLKIAWGVPIILIAVNSIWSHLNEQAVGVWPSMAGIIIGFFLYPKCLLLLPISFALTV